MLRSKTAGADSTGDLPTAEHLRQMDRWRRTAAKIYYNIMANTCGGRTQLKIS